MTRKSTQTVTFRKAQPGEDAGSWTPPVLSDEEIAEGQARWKADNEKKAAEIVAIRARLATLTGLPRIIADLHSPRPDDQPWWPRCTGCDMEGYEAERPDWPCSTIDALLKWLDEQEVKP